ncbi:MAG TPA: GNAT family N-acetyltransferase [Fimbriimonas sp.]|nr:GNAT family N-acetyltransferase [Fimbriimonas sp.]
MQSDRADLDSAVEVFVSAFSMLKSRTYPYVPTKVEDLWVMQDHPPRKKNRKIEVIATEIEPSEAIAQVNRADLGWHFMCHIHPDDSDFERIRAEYKAAGYRAMSREIMFVHDLAEIPNFGAETPIIQVQTPEQLKAIPQRADHSRSWYDNTRLYCAHDDLQDFGWVRSVPVGQDAWVSDLFVHAIDRGRGYGRALMSTLLQGDKAAGVRRSVLLASSDGARLYPHLGYKKIATLQMFCPLSRTK